MLLVKAWLLNLQSRSRIRRLKISGTVQGLVQESAGFDGRTMRARSSLGALRWRELRRFGGGLNQWTRVQRRDAERIQIS